MSTISAADRDAIQAGVRVMLERRHAAYLRFVRAIEELGGRGVDGALVADLYLRLKLARYDGMAYTVKHGGFLERDVILRAQAKAQEPVAPRRSRKAAR